MKISVRSEDLAWLWMAKLIPKNPMNPSSVPWWSQAVSLLLALAPPVLSGGSVTVAKLWGTEGLVESATDMRFSPDGAALAVGSDGGENGIHLVAASSGRRQRLLRLPSWVLAFSPDGRLLAAGGSDGIGIADAAAGTPVRALMDVQTTSLRAVAWSPDGALIAEGGLDSRVGLHAVGSGELVRSVPISGFCWVLAFSPDSRLLAAGGHRDIALIEAATGATVQLLRPYAEGAPNDGNMDTMAVAFTPDGRQLLTAGTGRVLRVWEVATGRLVRETLPQRCGIMAMAVSPAGGIAAYSDCAGINLVDPASGERLGRFEADVAPSRLVFSPDGSLLAAGGGSRVRLYRVTTDR